MYLKIIPRIVTVVCRSCNEYQNWKTADTIKFGKLRISKNSKDSYYRSCTNEYQNWKTLIVQTDGTLQTLHKLLILSEQVDF